MAVERIIGVDFGTSTSVIRVKRYADGKPVGDKLTTQMVSFDMGKPVTPTLVQRLATGESAYFGYDAETPRRNAQTFSNFKVHLEDPNEDVRIRARTLTAEFFAYMAKAYRAQSDGGHLGESSDTEKTYVSYPVKWSEETRRVMLETAKAAGFPNVEGIDEAQAAIRAVTVQNADLLANKGYFKNNTPYHFVDRYGRRHDRSCSMQSHAGNIAQNKYSMHLAQRWQCSFWRMRSGRIAENLYLQANAG